MRVGMPVVYALTALFSGIPALPLADAAAMSEEEAEIVVERHKIYKKEQK